jgi:tetratricopeptide (TPR) repeat protein
MDRHQEAIDTAREAIKIDPDYIYTYHVLAIAHSELGQVKEARAAAENILRIEPKGSISTYAQSQPYRDEELRDRIVEGLRKAGLPE